MPTINNLAESVVLLEDRMILDDEKAKAIRTPFELPSDPGILLEDGSVFPGNSGVIWEFALKMGFSQNGDQEIKYIPVIIIESENGFRLLVDRFVSGMSARLSYQIEMITRAKLIRENWFVKYRGLINEIYSDPSSILEHLIMRAGKHMCMGHLLKTDVVEDDLKRNPIESSNMYEAHATSPIQFGKHTWDQFSDICPASGATNHCFVLNYLIAKAMFSWSKGIIFNCCLGTINAFRRCLPPLLKSGKETVIFLSMGIFNVLREDVMLPGNELVGAGTIININNDPDDPGNKCFVSEQTMQYIQKYYPVIKKPDINGEVGEKTQDNGDRDVVKYDIKELYELMGNIIFKIPMWFAKIKAAFQRNPGLDLIIKKECPNLYKDLNRYGIIETSQLYHETAGKFTEIF